MSAICTICHESLEVTPSPPTVLFGGRNGTLACGHVFHVACINIWWRSFNEGVLEENRSYNCPICRRSSTFPFVFEIFLAMGPGNDENLARIRELEEIIQQLQGPEVNGAEKVENDQPPQ